MSRHPFQATQLITSVISLLKKKGWNWYVHAEAICMGLVLLCSLIICLWRPNQIPIGASVIYVIWYFLKDVYAHGITFGLYALLLGIDLILDIPWFIISASPLYNTAYIDDNSQSGIRKTAVIFSYINWVIKVNFLNNFF